MQAVSSPSPPAPWLCPSSAGQLLATVEVPGSKSLTNRALVLAGLSATPTRISGGLAARDSTLMIEALGTLGVSIDGPTDWRVTPGPFRPGAIDCGLAGTVMRFVPPIAALARGSSAFDGDAQARSRPMAPLIQSLRLLGAVIDGDRLPLTVHGEGGLPGGSLSLDFSASSQFVSALLLSAARFDKGIEIHHVGPPVPSLPHVAMTCEALRAAGVTVDDSEPDRWVVAPGVIDSPDLVIEPDLSNAAPFLAAALVAGGEVTVARWPEVTTQAGDQLRTLLAQMGADVSISPDGLTVSGTGAIGPLVADLHEVGELTPVLAALCALADGESRLRGIAHIRGHETNRLAAIRTELNAVGGDVEETDDGLIVRPARLSGGLWHAYDDHRMAHAGALLGLGVAGLSIDDIGCTAKTMSDFPAMWGSLLGQTR